MHIYLVRHGETDWNTQRRTQGIQDIPLSSHGIRQAESLGRRLEEESITHIYSSGLERAYKTALIAAGRLGIIPIIKEELQEINFGVWEGLTHKQIEEKYPGQVNRFRNDFSFFPQNGESLYTLEGKINRLIEFIQAKHAGENDRILLVSHAYPIRMVIVKLMHLPLRHLWDFKLDNTGISIIHLQPGNRRIICLNDTCHLKKITTER